MAEGQGTTLTATQDRKGGAPVQDDGSGGSWLNKPEQYGNAAGETIQSTLSPVGDKLGQGVETVTKPVGGVVDSLVGGVMRSGQAFGETVEVGSGNKEKADGENHGSAK